MRADRDMRRCRLWCLLVGCGCATRGQEGHWISRWSGVWNCSVSAYSEIFAVWGEVRLGRRSVGANTYTPVGFGDSEGRFVLVALRRRWRFGQVAGGRLSKMFGGGSWGCAAVASGRSLGWAGGSDGFLGLQRVSVRVSGGGRKLYGVGGFSFSVCRAHTSDLHQTPAAPPGLPYIPWQRRSFGHCRRHES